MINIATGRYWDEGIKLVESCTRCSPGCDNCWSLAMEKRFNGNKHKEVGRGIWCHRDRLSRFKTHKPKVFAIWNDLFHEVVGDGFQYEAYGKMIINKQNTYLILTKRPENMAKFFSPKECFNFPAFNAVWHGLTVCNQQEMEEKSEIFFSIPGNKFLSLEPLLSKVVVPPWVIEKKLLSCVILGGETGHGARPLHPDWARSVRDQCAAANVPFFFKGWGSYVVLGSAYKGNNWNDAGYNHLEKRTHGRILDGRTHDDLPWIK